MVSLPKMRILAQKYKNVAQECTVKKRLPLLTLF